MSKASRRNMLGIAAASMLMPAVAAASMPKHHPLPASPDAELLAACAAFDALERQYVALYDGPDAIEDDDECEAAARPIRLKQKPLLDKLTNLRATTLEGHLARIRSLVLEDQQLDIEELATSSYINQRLLGMVLRDLAEQAQARSAGA